MSVCECENKGMKFARLYDSTWGEASDQPAAVHLSRIGQYGLLFANKCSVYYKKPCRCRGSCLTSYASFQIWPDFTRRGDGMNQGVWTEGMTSQRDRSDNDNINNINGANNGGTGLGVLLMASPVRGRTRLLAFSRMRKAPRAVEIRP